MNDKLLHPIDLYSYHGIKIQTPFEYHLRQRQADREVNEKVREESINLQAELLKLKYSEQPL